MYKKIKAFTNLFDLNRMETEQVKGGNEMGNFYHSTYTKDGFRHIKLNSVNPDCFRYILKGRSDKVKANLFNNVAKALENQNLPFSVTCNYDGRITGIKCEEGRFILCDGTHPFEESALTFGGVDGIIGIEAFQKGNVLKSNGAEIVSIIRTLSEAERKCTRFLSAAAGVCRDRKRLEKENADSRKISRYAAKLWASRGCPPSGRVGVESKVFFSVPTADGIKCADCDLSRFCDTAIVISGSAGYCSDMIIDRMRRYALSSGIDVISCQSFLDFAGVPDHVIMPALRFGVFRENKNETIAVSDIKKVRVKRFMQESPEENTRVRLQFNQRACDSLMKEVENVMKKLQRCKKELDEIFVETTDENALFDCVCARIGL